MLLSDKPVRILHPKHHFLYYLQCTFVISKTIRHEQIQSKTHCARFFNKVQNKTEKDKFMISINFSTSVL